MDFILDTYPHISYSIKDPQQILTPRLLVFKRQVDYNIATMRRLLENVQPPLNLHVLCPHVKTHKSSWVTKKLMREGIHWFKCSPNELDMLLQAGAANIFLAYPLVEAMARQVAGKIIAHPQIKLYVQVSHDEHVAFLRRAQQEYDIEWHYFIDLDVGMKRTGISPQKAFDFYRSIAEEKNMVLAGLHAYDGHNHLSTIEERREEAQRSMGSLLEAVYTFRSHSVHVPRIIVGGTPAFLPDAEILYGQDLDCEVLLSPGTWIYFDTTYGKKMPDTFVPAALILCQVMDELGDDLYTLNLGHKRWAVDQGPVELFSISGMTAVKWSEEHTVVKAPQNVRLRIGDYILMVPRHVCSTVNLWEYFTLIGSDGGINVERCMIDARNR
ncbi:alanine racemase [candidate division KSB1 bacterium]|nr:alanine racemase [candidate division KSB1 bacterium]